MKGSIPDNLARLQLAHTKNLDINAFRYKIHETFHRDSSMHLVKYVNGMEMEFFARGLRDRNECIDQHYRPLIGKHEEMAQLSLCLWPCDIVQMRSANADAIGNYVNHIYNEKRDSHEFGWALVFCRDSIPRNLTTISSKLNNSEAELCYRNPFIKELAIELVSALKKLNEFGYAYYDMHFSRIFVHEENAKGDKNYSVYFDFSNLIYDINETVTLSKYEYPIDFAHPKCFEENPASFNVVIQNYNLAQMLFYLFTGKYAFDLEYFENESNLPIELHYLRLRLNLLKHKFIEQKKTCLDDQLYSYFYSIFNSQDVTPTTDQWLEYLQSM